MRLSVIGICNRIDVAAGIAAEVVAENRAVAAESSSPTPDRRQAEFVFLVMLVGEIDNDDRFIASATIKSSLESDNLMNVIDMMNINVLAGQTTCVPVTVETQADQSRGQLDDSGMVVGFLPIECLDVLEPTVF